MTPVNNNQKITASTTQETIFLAHHSNITWVEIDAVAFEHNIASYKKIVGPHVALAPVLKSNAYGHGIEIIAGLAQKNPNIDVVCVVSISEALQLRSLNFTKPIIVLSIIDNSIEQAIVHDIALVVYDVQQAQEIHAVAQKIKKIAQIHIKIDTGLSRLGVRWHQATLLLQTLLTMPFLSIQGICTHFAQSESEDQAFSFLQLQRFNALLDYAQQHNISFKYIHSSCSAALGILKECHGSLSRLGIGIYGLWPSQKNKNMVLQQHPSFSLKPILSWKTKVIQVKTLEANSYIGYDRTFYNDKPMTIAVLPVGYWDGYDRLLSNKGHVIINNQAAPIVGRIAMNMMMVDITNIAHVERNTHVLLLGDHPLITADQLAHHCNTINYEIVTRINPLLQRLLKP